MIKYLFTFILLNPSFIAFGQLIERPIHVQQSSTKAQKINKLTNARVSEETDITLTLPFWDDFSGAEGIPSPLLWMDNGNVDISGTIGINAPTYNVAVFNGVNTAGIPYNIDDNGTVPVDTLVSHRIDLTQVPTNSLNSLFLSFFVQPGGLGELPDPDDSFALFFLDSDSNWVDIDITTDASTTVIRGGQDAVEFSSINPEEQIFSQVIVRIPAKRETDPENIPNFIHENFRFRFQANGNQQGTFDSWLLDYVYANFNRNPGDIFYEDRSISRGIDATFGSYKSIPYDHFFENRNDLTDRFEFTLSNLDNILQILNYSIEVSNRETNERVSLVEDLTEFDGGISADGILRGLEIASDSSSTVTGSQLMNAPDTTLLDIKLSLFSRDTIGPNPLAPFGFLTNDTVTTQLNLVNTYAYDDGSAEFSAGINRNRGQVAVEYVLLSEDTLTGIEINFPIIFPSSEDARIELFVRRNLRDEPGSIAVSQRVPNARLLRSRANDSSLVNFIYDLREHKIVSDTIYIGFQQFTNDFIPIGLDKNNDNGDRIFFNLEENWIQNETVQGSLMIRPIFGTADPFIPTSNEEVVIESRLTLFPNPTSGMLNINGRYDHIQIYDLSGKQVPFTIHEANPSTVDISNLQQGIYIVRLAVGNEFLTKRIIKK